MARSVFRLGVVLLAGAVTALLVTGTYWATYSDDPGNLDSWATRPRERQLNGSVWIWAWNKHPVKWLRLSGRGTYTILQHVGSVRSAGIVGRGGWVVVSPERGLIGLTNPLSTVGFGGGLEDALGVRLLSPVPQRLDSYGTETVKLERLVKGDTCRSTNLAPVSDTWCAESLPPLDNGDVLVELLSDYREQLANKYSERGNRSAD
jgi:hypothetical protein